MRPQRERLDATPEAVVGALPAMGRLMITAAAHGVTHERMGVVERIAAEAGALRCAGGEHDCLIEPAALSHVVADRTGRMGERVLPRLDFTMHDGSVAFSAVGLEGLESFEAGLKRFEAGAELPPAERKPPHGAASQGAGEGAGAEGRPLERAAETQAAIGIDFVRAGFRQSWSGVVPAVRVSMGFVNIILPDFHLHVRQGAIAEWRRAGGGDAPRLEAIGADGAFTGLTVHGPAVHGPALHGPAALL